MRQLRWNATLVWNGLNHYSPVLHIYTLWKHQKIERFSDIFRGYRQATPGCNGLSSTFCLVFRVELDLIKYFWLNWTSQYCEVILISNLLNLHCYMNHIGCFQMLFDILHVIFHYWKSLRFRHHKKSLIFLNSLGSLVKTGFRILTIFYFVPIEIREFISPQNMSLKTSLWKCSYHGHVE